jgi:hypothetical protein
MSNYIDLTNLRFGYLTVLEYSHTNKNRKAHWKCICDCGNISIVIGQSLREGRSKSCGRVTCEYSHTIKSEARSVHGLSTTKEYQIWNSMVQRCTNPNDRCYIYYGARGIAVYSEWINNPQAFIDYLKTLPETWQEFELRTGRRATLDRINNDEGYIPENLRWVSHQIQNENKRDTFLTEDLVKFILLKKKEEPSITIKKLADICECSPSTVSSILQKKAWKNVTLDDSTKSQYI